MVDAKLVVLPTHTVCVPVKAFTVGKVFTVTVVDALSLHPLALMTKYLITLVPAATPVTTPVLLFTVATDVVVLLQLPPIIVLLNVVVLPIQTLAVPVFAATVGFAFTTTVTLLVAALQPPIGVTVTEYVPLAAVVALDIIGF